jgi:CRP-like cAMP-binding protein
VKGRSPATGWLLAALGLTLTALLLGVQFMLETTGGTLFLFATVAPGLVVVATVILGAVLYRDFRRRHRLFDIERYQAGDVVFRQGTPGDSAYFIRSGEVEIVREAGGAESVIARLGAGQYFGETALLTQAPRNASVRASSPTELAVLGKENFLTMLSLLPATHEDVLKTVQQRAMQAEGS